MILLEGQCVYDCFFVLATLKSIVVVFLDNTSGGTFALTQRMPTGFQECHHGAQYFSIPPPPTPGSCDNGLNCWNQAVGRTSALSQRTGYGVQYTDRGAWGRNDTR